MAKQPKTTSEHLISIYGYITGLKREITTIKNNHLKHMHDDIDKLHSKTIPINNKLNVPIQPNSLNPRRRIHKIMKGYYL